MSDIFAKKQLIIQVVTKIRLVFFQFRRSLDKMGLVHYMPFSKIYFQLYLE